MEGKTSILLLQERTYSSSCKVQILGDFIEHATGIETDITELERTFANPCTFYGTTRRSKSASEVLTQQINDVKKMRDEVKTLIEDLRRTEEENNSMLSEIEQFSMEMEDLKINLEERGFSFTSEHHNSVTDEVNSWKDSEEEACVMMEDNGNVEMNRTRPTECVEKYLEDNNLELDDLVTPYIQRKSCLSKRSV